MGLIPGVALNPWPTSVVAHSNVALITSIPIVAHSNVALIANAPIVVHSNVALIASILHIL